MTIPARFIGALVVLALLSLAVFGGFAMHEVMSEAHGVTCFISIVQTADCGTQASALGHLNFHIDGLKELLTATGTGQGLALAALVLLLLGIFFACAPPSKPFSYTDSRANWLRVDSVPSVQVLLKWLSLHENSPATL